MTSFFFLWDMRALVQSFSILFLFGLVRPAIFVLVLSALHEYLWGSHFTIHITMNYFIPVNTNLYEYLYACGIQYAQAYGGTDR